jgi:hypothetical protein
MSIHLDERFDQGPRAIPALPCRELPVQARMPGCNLME